jgi:hypothetical protein
MTEKINIYQKLQKMRVELQNKGLTKSGKNTYNNYEYFELSDFLPHINQIQQVNNTVSIFDISAERATLSIINCDDTAQIINFSIPIAELALKGANAIQNMGGLTTYCRRYLYMIAFEIAENEEFDLNKNNDPKEPEIFYVDDIKIKILKEKMAEKGVEDITILECYKVSSFEELTVEQFMAAMKRLEITPVKENKQVDLGL